MKRIMIVGAPGSGKSTLARQLGEATGLPVFHMDQIHWKAGWVERPLDEKVPMAHEVEAGERWIFEGGLSATYENRAAQAHMIIWLDLPMVVRLFRVFKRICTYRGETRPDLPEGCPEHLNFEFLHYIVTTNRRHRAKLKDLIERHSDTPIVHLRSGSDVNRWRFEVKQSGMVAA